MDKKTYETLDIISYAVGGVLYFVAAMKIANSNMKAFWKVLCLNLAIITCKECGEKGIKIIERTMSNDDSIKYVKKVK